MKTVVVRSPSLIICSDLPAAMAACAGRFGKAKASTEIAASVIRVRSSATRKVYSAAVFACSAGKARPACAVCAVCAAAASEDSFF